MTRLFTLFMLALLSCNAAFASYFPETAIKSSTKTSYVAASTFVAPAASTTDLFEIFGSSTKTIKLLRVEIAYYGASTGTVIDECFLVRRSTANTSGTSTTLTNIKLDTNNASATAVAKSYTANPTTGTLVGTVTSRCFSSISLPASQIIPIQGQPCLVLFDANLEGQPIVLRGTSEGACVNFNGVKPYAGTPKLAVVFYWTEE